MNQEETGKRIIQKIIASKLKPLFADEVFVGTSLKMGKVKTKKGKERVEKEAHLVLSFIDMSNQEPIVKIVIRTSTARGLVNALTENVNKIDKELESKELPKKTKEKISTTEHYIT